TKEFPEGVPRPGWGDHSVSLVIVLAASLSELLVFLSVCYGLTDSWLRHRGFGRVLAALPAGALACFLFGIFHYTHDPTWWPYAFPLMAEMAIVWVYFLVTRNFYLTFLLHNAFAATGFTDLLARKPDKWHEIAAPGPLAVNVTVFVIAFL